MKRARPNDLGLCVKKFFRAYLPVLRGMSQHTIHSYRDALILFLRFASDHSGRRLEDLDLTDFTAEHVGQFLTHLPPTLCNLLISLWQLHGYKCANPLILLDRRGKMGLTSLEAERHNGIATRNAQLAALHTFARFLATESPEHLAELQRILGVPFKRNTVQSACRAHC
jgi:integrase/recombinase XerD